MEKKFKTERAVAQQQLICTGLLDLMEKMPYEEISVSSICQHTGIPRRTFYYYFERKEEALNYLIHWLLMESTVESTIFAGLTSTALKENLSAFFTFWRDVHSRELHILMRNGLEQKLILQCLQVVSTEKRWAYMLEDYSEEEKDISMMMGISSVMYALFYWCSRDFSQSPEYMAECITRVLTLPICRET